MCVLNDMSVALTFSVIFCVLFSQYFLVRKMLKKSCYSLTFFDVLTP